MYSAHLIVSLHRKARMMRKVMLLTLLSVLALFACTDRRYPTTLVAADSLCAVNPDSALHLLTQYKDSIQTASKAHRMYYHLLLADAMNKAYVDMTTDSILKEVADYYDRHGSANEQMRAHYLLGCAYRDMGEAPMALQCYQDAVDQADTLSQDCNYRLLTSVYGQMAEIFHKQNLPEDEIEVRRKCQKYSLLGKDTTEYLISCQSMVKPYFLLGDTVAMLKVLDDVYQKFLQRGDTIHADNIYGGTVFIDNDIKQGKLDDARKRMHVFESKGGHFDKYGYLKDRYATYYYIKHQYFVKSNQIDSAEFYARELLSYPDEKVNAYRGLLTVFQMRNHSDSLVKYARLYEDAIDTLHNSMRIETVHQMTSMYNYQRYQQIVSMKERSERRMIRIVIFSVLTLITIFMLIINRYRKNRRERQAKVLRLFQKFNDTIRKYNKATEELDKLKSKDNSLLSDKEQEIHELTQQLASYRDILSSIRSRDQLSRFKKSDVISLFKEMSVGKRDCRLPDEEDWNRLAEQFSIFLPTTSNVIGSPQLLSPQELRTCILLAAGFTNGEIGVLLNASPQLISNIKTRVNRKLFGEETAATLMDNLVHLLGNV